MPSMSETGEPAGPQWSHVPTEEPLSPSLTAAVVEDLKESWYFGECHVINPCTLRHLVR
jgi:hypothetical protein